VVTFPLNVSRRKRAPAKLLAPVTDVVALELPAVCSHPIATPDSRLGLAIKFVTHSPLTGPLPVLDTE
jgi:hypothetical protein